MDIKNINELSSTPPVSVLPMFQSVFNDKGINGSFNYVEIDEGVTVPNEGYSIHDEDELSIVIKGNLEVEIEGKIYYVKTGDYTLIRKGTPHISKNLTEEKCVIVSLLI